MLSSLPRVSVVLSAFVAVLSVMALPTEVAAQRAPGVHLTRNGFRAPVFGVSQSQDADGNLVAECVALSAEQIEAFRFGRTVSRSMEASSPQAVVSTEGGTTFEVSYPDAEGTGFRHPAEGGNRRQALEKALSQWSKAIKTEQTIRVTASMRSIDDGDNNPATNVLAFGGPTEFWLLDNIAVPSALAWQIAGGRFENAKDSDITLDVNDKVDWDYSVSGVAQGNRASFVYTMMHELTHGLGFIQSFSSTTGKVLNDPFPFPYDLFINRGSAQRNRLIDHAPEEVTRDLKSNDVFFNGPSATEASLAAEPRPMPMVKLHAPDPYRSGSSIGHIDSSLFSDTRPGLMTPVIGKGTDQIDAFTLAIIKDLGYTLVPPPQQ